MMKTGLAAGAALFALLGSVPATADEDIQTLRAELQEMKQTYEDRIAELESRLAQMEQTRAAADLPVPAVPATAQRGIRDNSFNPSIGILLNGRYSLYSSDEAEIAGFAVGHEGERPRQGFSVEHTELNAAANVDDKFYASITAAIADHDGATEIELEEAYLQTLPGAGLPDGVRLKAGRAFWTLGYLNEHHSHTDDFADRPLPYRVFLNQAFNDDGAEVSYLLPTQSYAEIGGGLFRGDDSPFGAGDGEGIGAWSAYARTGGDIGGNQSWRLGGYALHGETNASAGHADDEHGDEDEDEHSTVEFFGDTELYIVDLRYTWAPTGNPRAQELTFQGEYFRRRLDGIYNDVAFNGSTLGWYTQAVYKFSPQWRIGARYSTLEAQRIPASLAGSAADAAGHDPEDYSVMLDWTNSEFSRIRLQYNHARPTHEVHDNQLMLQYILGIGAHSAHKY